MGQVLFVPRLSSEAEHPALTSQVPLRLVLLQGCTSCLHRECVCVHVTAQNLRLLSLLAELALHLG